MQQLCVFVLGMYRIGIFTVWPEPDSDRTV